MKQLISKAKLLAVLVVTALLVIIGAFNLRDRLSLPPVADDGIQWINTENGIQARSIDADSPLRYYVKRGDYLRAVYYVGKYESVNGVRALEFERVALVEDLDRYLETLGVGAEARYAIEHDDTVLQAINGVERPLYDVDFRITKREQESIGFYLAFVGLVYLAIGLFVLFKQSQATLTYHFYAWFLISFIVYFYTSTREFNGLDKAVYLIDGAALALLAPVFLHFCANFPSGRGLSLKSRPPAVILYLPALVLIGLGFAWQFKIGFTTSLQLDRLRSWLNWAEILHYAVFFISGSALLLRTYRRTQSSLLRQQLRWIIWGLGLSVLPFVGFYGIPFIVEASISPLMTYLGFGPLILIPLSFGYSIVRYRLMDVDVIVRRSFVHVMATAAVGAIYMAVLLGVGDVVKFIWANADLNTFRTKIVVVACMLVVAMLFAPIKNRLQVWADRWFYGERYNLRTGLQDFGRTLAQTTVLPQLLDSLVRRLSDMLSVRKVAIFIEDPKSPSGFSLAHATGVEPELALPRDIKKILRTRSLGRGYVTADDLVMTLVEKLPRPAIRSLSTVEMGVAPAVSLDRDDETIGRTREALTYYVPCVVRDRMVAIIGIGRAASGALLTSEDADLLRALSGYVAVAIDNSLLYKSETEKAEELVRLKEFSENIIESVNVGILVVDRDGMITTWNNSLAEIFGIARERALGRNIREMFDHDLIETIQNAAGRQGWSLIETRHIYKYNATTEDGRPLTINVSLAPFEAARGVVTGTLIVIENVTDRVQLEQQLLQREKLSSIGLLAAGVAHEVNTPLAGISSYAQMLLQQVPEDDSRHGLLEKIRAQTLRASAIVNNLLNFSRTGDAQFREVELNKVLEDTLQLLEPQLRSTSIEIVKQFGDRLPSGYGNVSKLQQVFMNLILNARDAMPGGGCLTIHTRLVETSLVVEFRDTGIGIAPENIARIYDPFFTTKEVGLGTGLGLALSYGIIQEHGGRIFVESRPGEGAHFTIKLPTAFTRQLQVASD
jgi:PAS domain S-box-containing protein